ncbi:MBL fold metallo-hydrolase RNA specificity domain-containing protein, partial [Methanocaldococcus sp.]
KPEKAIVMHGERYQSLSFAMAIWKNLKIPAYVPVKGTILPI